MKRFFLLPFALVLVAPACAVPSGEEELSETSDQALDRGDALPAVQAFEPLRIKSAYTSDCLATGATMNGWTYEGRAFCDTSARLHFTTKRLPNGNYVFRNVESGRCLDVLGASMDDGARVIEFDCHEDENQQWRPVQLDAQTYRLMAAHSGKCLDVNLGAGGTQIIQQWSCHDGANQRWSVAKAPATSIYVRTGASSSARKCLDVPGAADDDGARLQQWDCWGGDNQRFWFLRFANGSEIRATHSGKCLEVAGAGDTNGTPVVQSTCMGAPEQRFSANGTSIRPGHIAKCLDRDAQINATNGASLQLWACHGGANQSFSFDTGFRL